MTKAKPILVAISVLLLATLGCNAVPHLASPALGPTQTLASLPQTEADVPRVTAEEAKAAVEAGEAVIVDVRDASSYELEHVAGALSIPLADIEEDAAAVPLDKARWIITYCT